MEEKQKKIKVIDILPPESKIKPKRGSEATAPLPPKEKKEKILEAPILIQTLRSNVPAGPKKAEPRFKKTLLFLIILFFLSGSVYAAIEILPRVEIKITAQKLNWDFNDRFSASKNISSINLEKKQIPAEIFSSKKNLNLLQLATGKKYVEKKASGEIIIYNAYSSSPQLLIRETKFLAPDGKIFLLDKKIVVPGAKIIEGKIVPSSIKAKVAAEKAGEEYNIGPAERFTIPGFKGSPKYQGFYANSTESMSGGFIGEMIFPTDEDIKIAKEKAKKMLSDGLMAFLSTQIPGDFKVIDAAEELSILSEKISQEIDENGNFSVFLEAELKTITFKEIDVLNLIAELAKKTLGADFEVKESKIDYSNSQVDFKNGELSFMVDYRGIFWRPIDLESFKHSILSKKESDLKISVFSLAGVEKATVSFWPFWVKKVPNKVEKIKIEIE